MSIWLHYMYFSKESEISQKRNFEKKNFKSSLCKHAQFQLQQALSDLDAQ